MISTVCARRKVNRALRPSVVALSYAHILSLARAKIFTQNGGSGSFPRGEETTTLPRREREMHQRRIGRRREDTSRSRSSSASCSPRVSDGGGGIITPRRDPRPSFSLVVVCALKAADGLRVKSRRKKPPGRVDEEDDFDRVEKRDDESGGERRGRRRFFATTTRLPAARGRRKNRFRRSRRTWTRSRRTSCSSISAQRESGGVFIREGELAGGDAIEKSDV